MNTTNETVTGTGKAPCEFRTEVIQNPESWRAKEIARRESAKLVRLSQFNMNTTTTKEISEAYDIKNVDIRNLLTVAVGTLSNQTGESFDSALSRGKCADEILRRFAQVTAQRDELLAALQLLMDVYGGKGGRFSTKHWNIASNAISKAEQH